jgi:4-diphosphocytidyl-2-C-methyl-D-erythritol kinase
VLAGEDNLCFKAARLFAEETSLDWGLDIHIEKRIPKGGGLGGASADAAAVLCGLNDLASCGLPEERMHAMAAKLGSDVNFFVGDAPFALGTGRGEVITPIYSDKVFHHILVLGHEESSTPSVFKRFTLKDDRIGEAQRFVEYLKVGKGELPKKLLFNALTEPYCAQSSKAQGIFAALSEAGETFLLSGSGATINVMVPAPDHELSGQLRARLAEYGASAVRVSTVQSEGYHGSHRSADHAQRCGEPKT